MKALPLLLVAAFLATSALQAEAQTSTRKPASSKSTGTKKSSKTKAESTDTETEKTAASKKTSSESSKSSGATKGATSSAKKETGKPAADTAKTGKTEPAKASEKKSGSSAKKAGTKSGSSSAKSKTTEKDKTASDTPAGSAAPQKKAPGNEVLRPASAEAIAQPKVKPPQDNAGEDLTRKTRVIGPNITLDPADLADFDANPPEVQRLLNAGLDLTRQNLTYRYGSSDPNSGGMDCSGTIYYLLKAAGVKEPPRDSSGMYLWTQKEGTLKRVSPKTLEDPVLDDLKPGDLMFWEGTYEVQRDPPISHTMIYLGREKQTGIRVMVGASDGRVYDSVSRNGVSVFDFQLPRSESTAKFVGYARVPGLEHAKEPAKQ